MSQLEKLNSQKVAADTGATDLAKRSRRVRTPMSGRRNILTVSNQDPNYVYRWCDNNPDRVDELSEIGYEPVTHKVRVGERSIEQGGDVGAAVTRRVGGGREQILMRILKEWYVADQKVKQGAIDATAATMKQQGKQEGFYGNVTESTRISKSED